MDRYNFSSGHIFIKSYENATFWTIFMNGAGNCGGSGSKDQAMKDILSHWKLTEKIRIEIKGIFEKKNPVESVRIGDQLELF